MSRPFAWQAYLLLIVSALGCARWSQHGDVTLDETIQLPAPPIAHDGVVMEIAQISVDGRRLAAAKVWRQLDENVLPLDKRRQLNDNGIRVGRIGGQLPTALHELITSKGEIDVQTESGKGLKLDGRTRYQTIQTRAGKTKEVQIGRVRESLVVLDKEGGRLRGETLDQAQCMLKMKATPDSDRRVSLQLTPEIAYGRTRQTWTGVEGAWKLSPERARKIYKQLRLVAPLAPGESLLIASTAEPIGLGAHYFAPDESSRLLILIRLSQSRLNPLFSPEDETTPTVTPVE